MPHSANALSSSHPSESSGTPSSHLRHLGPLRLTSRVGRLQVGAYSTLGSVRKSGRRKCGPGLEDDSLMTLVQRGQG
jgi:hypothetical protein